MQYQYARQHCIRHQCTQQQTGAVLIACLVLLTATSLLSVAQSDNTTVMLRLIKTMQLAERSRLLADTAVQRATTELRRDPQPITSGNSWQFSENDDNGRMQATAVLREQYAACGGEPDHTAYRIEVLGSGFAHRKLETHHVQGLELCISAEGRLVSLSRLYWHPLGKEAAAIFGN